MKEYNIIVLRIASTFFGISIMLGFIWFGDYFASKSIISILFEMSTGIAFLIYALMPSFLLEYIIIRIFLTLLIIIGAANSICMMPGDWMLINGPDYGALIFRTIAIFLFIIILRHILRQRNKPAKK